MNTRSLAVIAVLIFFSFAPSALATPCGVGGTCQYLYCSSNTTAVAGSSDCNWAVGQLCCAPSVQQNPGNIVVPGNGQVVSSPTQLTPASTPTTPAPGAQTQPSVNNTAPAQSQSSVNNTGTNVTLINPLGAGTSLTTLLNSVLKFVVQIGAVIVILMLVYVGFKFVVAQGNPAKIEEARRMLLWTIVGALILLGAQVIAIGICETTNALSTGGSVISCAF
jgi:Type IV secretion system pilin